MTTLAREVSNKGMNRILAALLLLTLAAPAGGQGFEKGMQTFRFGDCATDLLGYRPAAEHGGAQAQYCLAEGYARGQGGLSGT